jgi:hypothetical protein
MQQVGHGDVPGLHAGGVDGGRHLPVPIAALLPQHRHSHLRPQQCEHISDTMASTQCTETSDAQASCQRCKPCCSVSISTRSCASEAVAVKRVPSCSLGAEDGSSWLD